MKTKHFTLSLLSTLLLFSCGLQPAFTQQALKQQPDKGIIVISLTELQTNERIHFMCTPMTINNPSIQQEFK